MSLAAYMVYPANHYSPATSINARRYKQTWAFPNENEWPADVTKNRRTE
jgi:hypothetical protein